TNKIEIQRSIVIRVCILMRHGTRVTKSKTEKRVFAPKINFSPQNRVYPSNRDQTRAIFFFIFAVKQKTLICVEEKC
ncbi:MAG TPA: hypothetical protein VER35_03150, partial [Candidatus Limnocylindrales bacterium]|nr:hypothetical protein [Candidatus Limnocylindrales bacterium]